MVRFCEGLGVRAVVCSHWAEGSAGAAVLACEVAALCDAAQGEQTFIPAYALDLPLKAKIEAIARKIYRAGGITLTKAAEKNLKLYESDGWGDLPICIAKTPYSFSADPTRLGAPSGHILPVTEVRLSAGAGFVVAICGDIMTMPGLPKVPGAAAIHLDEHGRIKGLT